MATLRQRVEPEYGLHDVDELARQVRWPFMVPERPGIRLVTAEREGKGLVHLLSVPESTTARLGALALFTVRPLELANRTAASTSPRAAPLHRRELLDGQEHPL
jgi:hypothetical protein